MAVDGKIKYDDDSGKILYSAESGKISIECADAAVVTVYEPTVKVVAPVILNSHQGTWIETGGAIWYVGIQYAPGVGKSINIAGTDYWNIEPYIYFHSSPTGPFQPTGWWFHVSYRFNDGVTNGFDGFFEHMPGVVTVNTRLEPPLQFVSPEGSTDNLFGTWQFGQDVW